MAVREREDRKNKEEIIKTSSNQQHRYWHCAHHLPLDTHVYGASHCVYPEYPTPPHCPHCLTRSAPVTVVACAGVVMVVVCVTVTYDVTVVADDMAQEPVVLSVG